MSFSATYQPQVAVALSHISTVINSMRNGSVGVLIPKGRRQRVVVRQHRPEVTEGSEREEEAKTVEAEQLDVDTCMAILMQVDSIAKLSALMGVPENNHWKTNFVSAPTFFENKTGFTEQMLEMPNTGGFSLFLKPEISRLLSQTLSPVYVPRRGFKQERKQPAKKTGLGHAEESYLKFFTRTLGSPKQQNWDQQTLHRILKDEQPHVQDKIKLAYAEGIMNSDGQVKDNSNWTQRWKVIKNTVYVVLGLYLVYFFFFTRGGSSASGPGITGGIPGLGHTNFEVNPDEIHVTFKDVKGCDEAKEELANIVEFLKDKEKFEAVGAKLPKGVLMVGAPGVGKTLLAKAVAGEAGVPFFEASGSQFDDMFVGSGSRKVRQLFAAAKARAPSVIFIDEIDSVGAKRTNSQIHPYANQTVNQLLSEMDGFAGSSGVIVIGATNKKDNLDKALLRPGRFDMEVTVQKPDARGREEIFKLYLAKVKSDPQINLHKLGKLSIGMTGADISNIVNQAALCAVLQGHSIVTMHDLDYARDRIKMGPAWKNKKIDEKTNWNTAYHEAGHTLVAFYTEEAMPIHKVTIQPRGQSLGHTAFLPTKEHGATKAQLLAKIDVAMGGRIGEELIFGKDQVTTGASNDFAVATKLATMMVKKLGMSDKVGQRVHNDPAMDGGSTFIQVNDLSPEMQQILDMEINKILNEAYARGMNILKSHKQEHKLLAQALIKYETLSADEVRAVIEGKPIQRKFPEKSSTKNGSKKDINKKAPEKPIKDISGQ